MSVLCLEPVRVRHRSAGCGVLVLARRLAVAERHLVLVLVVADVRIAGVVGDPVVVDHLVRVAVGDEDHEIRENLVVGPGVGLLHVGQVPRYPEAVLPVGAAVRVVTRRDVRLEGVGDRLVGDWREGVLRRAAQRQTGNCRELRYCEARSRVAQRRGERAKRRLYVTLEVLDRARFVEHDVDVDPTLLLQVRVGDRSLRFAGCCLRRRRAHPRQ